MTGDGGFIGVRFLSHSDERAIARQEPDAYIKCGGMGDVTVLGTVDWEQRGKAARATAEAFSDAMRAIGPLIGETARSIEDLQIALLGWESPARWRRFRQELLRRTGARLDANEREVERWGR